MDKFDWNAENFGAHPPLKLGLPIGFGKYAKLTIEDVCEKDIEYLIWLTENGCELDNEAYSYFTQFRR